MTLFKERVSLYRPGGERGRRRGALSEPPSALLGVIK